MTTVDMPLAENVRPLQERLRGELQTLDGRILHECPLEGFVRALDAYPAAVPLGYMSRDVRRRCDRIEAIAGQPGLELYHQCLLLELMARAWPELPARQFPADIPALYEQQFRRIVRQIERKPCPAGFYLPAQISKDVGLCTFRFIPAGPGLIHLHRLPRVLFFNQPPRRLAAWTAFVLKMGGIRSFFEFHLPSNDPRALAAEFTPEGWKRFYRRTAALLQQNPRVKGIMAGSWFFDPALEEVSPELAYLRTLVTENGGRAFQGRPIRGEGLGGATLLSPVRKRLYEEGKYTPTGYLIVWPRKELIAWAQRG